MSLVLSLFPGIGLLDMAFEEHGFCVVRGPDLLWGGDVRRFHPPGGKFDGIIGGPPCQAFSSLGNMARARGQNVAPNLIPEFERCVLEAAPQWFVMENVEGAPLPGVDGYEVRAVLLNNRWCGGEQNRVRRFSFGSREGLRLEIPGEVFEPVNKSPAVTANATIWKDGRPFGDKSERYFRNAVKLQGLPEDFDLPVFTVAGKIKAVGNGVPLPMGRAVAQAVLRATAAAPPAEEKTT